MIIDGKHYIILQAKTIHETSEAVLFRFEDEEENTWIPKFYLEDWQDIGEEGDVILMEWIAKEKELI